MFTSEIFLGMTYGTPRVGNPAWAALFDSLVSSISTSLWLPRIGSYGDLLKSWGRSRTSNALTMRRTWSRSSPESSWASHMSREKFISSLLEMQWSAQVSLKFSLSRIIAHLFFTCIGDD